MGFLEGRGEGGKVTIPSLSGLSRETPKAKRNEISSLGKKSINERGAAVLSEEGSVTGPPPARKTQREKRIPNGEGGTRRFGKSPKPVNKNYGGTKEGGGSLRVKNQAPYVRTA